MLEQLRRAYLEAMGIALWEERNPSPPGDAVTVMPAETAPEIAPGTVDRAPGEPAPGQAPPVFEEVPLDAYQHIPPDDVEDEQQPPGPPAVHELDWPALGERVAGCRNCTLCESRSNTVFGVGDRQASLMVIGEAPGADEDRQGEPFVGRAGQLLTAMLAAIGLRREQVYIANILKCRPPGNRDPHVEEVAACQPFLDRQIELIRPRLILSVGGVSAKNLLHTDESVGRLRGQVHRYPATDTPLLVTYHPAYLLRRPEEKAKAWQDLQQAWRLLHVEAGQ